MTIKTLLLIGALLLSPMLAMAGTAKMEPGAKDHVTITGAGVTTKTIGTGLLTAADCTVDPCTPAAVYMLPIGSKSITGSAVSTTSGATIAQTQKIYGSDASTMTSADSTLLCTITLSGTQSTTKAITATCPPITANFLYYGVINSATTTSGNATTGTVTAKY